MTPLQIIYKEIEAQISKIPMDEFLMAGKQEKTRREKQIEEIFNLHLTDLDPQTAQRIRDEHFAFGPLEHILSDESATEIIINSEHSIWFESHGQLQLLSDTFYSTKSYQDILERLTQKANIHVTQESPRSEGHWGPFRMTLIGPSLTGGNILLNLRRHPVTAWTLDSLFQKDWCTSVQAESLRSLIKSKTNFMVVGGTGTGKTSVLNALLQELSVNERAVIIEDTSELKEPNSASIKLLTRNDPHNILPPINQTDLLKSTLRLRPDRIIMGEVRGVEAKDFLMALATGHEGSFGTLHAQNPGQALIRLEMLIQMGAPQWNLIAIRRLLQMSLNYVLMTGKDPDGKRKFQGAYKLCSLEDNGFLIEQVF